MKTLTFIDLFCGAGGFSEGFKQAGYTPLLGLDKCAQAKETYEKNIGAPCITGDMRDYPAENILNDIGYQVGEIDIVIGGPPCQGFSTAGKLDKYDERNSLYKHFVELIGFIKPKVFVMENVPAIKSHNNGATLANIYESFREVGYSITAQKLNAVYFGVPQTRERMFFVGSKSGEVSFPPKNTHYSWDDEEQVKNSKRASRFISASEAISDLLLNGDFGSEQSKYKIPAQSKYQQERRKQKQKLFNHVASHHTDKVIERFSKFKEGDKIQDLPHNYKTNKMVAKRLRRDRPSPTIMTLPDDLIHYAENRILTVREMARIQSFDDTFRFYGKRTTGGDRRKRECPQYTLVGNAVPPLLAKAIAMELKKSPALSR